MKNLLLIVTFSFFTFFCSNATSQFSHSKIVEEIQTMFLSYFQLQLTPAIHAAVENALKQYTFTIKYGQSSPKKIDLDNTLVKVKVYYNGYPKGTTTVATDQDQHFIYSTLEDRKSIIFELISIYGQDQSHLKCHGSSLPGFPELEVVCKQSR